MSRLTCPKCMHTAHKPGHCATPSIDGCDCGMTPDQRTDMHRRQAAAEALREAADDLAEWDDWTAATLRDRADRIERGDDD